VRKSLAVVVMVGETQVLPRTVKPAHVAKSVSDLFNGGHHADTYC
jgi:hypothetical protein